METFSDIVTHHRPMTRGKEAAVVKTRLRINVQNGRNPFSSKFNQNMVETKKILDFIPPTFNVVGG